MSKPRKIRFTVNACKFFDSSGNTYHSVRCTRISDGAVIASGKSLVYGYSDHYQLTALELMREAGWIRCKRNALHQYDRKHNYPIVWHASYGLKRDAVNNGSI